MSNLKAGVDWLGQIFETFLLENEELIGNIDKKEGREISIPLTKLYSFGDFKCLYFKAH